jgi:hypothetical protein
LVPALGLPDLASICIGHRTESVRRKQSLLLARPDSETVPPSHALQRHLYVLGRKTTLVRKWTLALGLLCTCLLPAISNTELNDDRTENLLQSKALSRLPTDAVPKKSETPRCGEPQADLGLGKAINDGVPFSQSTSSGRTE